MEEERGEGEETGREEPVRRRGERGEQLDQLFWRENRRPVRTADEQREDDATREASLADLRAQYYAVGGPLAYASLADLYRVFRDRLSRKDIREFLSSQNVHTLFPGPRVRPRKFNQYYIYRRRNQLQADLVEVSPGTVTDNDGFRYIITILDSFSRRIWTRELKNKTGPHVLDVFSSVLETEIDPEKKVKVLVTDKGR